MIAPKPDRPVSGIPRPGWCALCPRAADPALNASSHRQPPRPAHPGEQTKYPEGLSGSSSASTSMTAHTSVSAQGAGCVRPSGPLPQRTCRPGGDIVSQEKMSGQINIDRHLVGMAPHFCLQRASSVGHLSPIAPLFDPSSPPLSRRGSARYCTISPGARASRSHSPLAGFPVSAACHEQVRCSDRSPCPIARRAPGDAGRRLGSLTPPA